MHQPSKILFLTPLALFSLSSLSLAGDIKLASGREPKLETAGAPYAPLEVSKQGGQYPGVPLSKSQRNELLGEFKGLVHMGLSKVSYERWEGREMADCEKPENPADRWSYRCEIITGQGNGYYYFYPSESRQSATLQNLDIRVHAADENLLDDFKRPVQDMFGKASLVEKPSVRSKPTGVIRHWNTENDVAELFIDHSIRPEGSVRFVWMRSPLIAGAHASLPAHPVQAE